MLSSLQSVSNAFYAKEMGKYKKAYLPTQCELGDGVWVRNLPRSDDKNFNKFERIWTVPYEIMEVVGADRYCIATSGRPNILGIERLKTAFPLLHGAKLKVQHHAPSRAPNDDDTRVVEDVVDHNKIHSTTKKGKQIMKWLVKRKQHDEWTWDARDQFLNNVCD